MRLVTKRSMTVSCAVLGLSLAVALSGCGADSSNGADPSSAAQQRSRAVTATTGGASTAPATSAEPVDPTTVQSAGSTYTVRKVEVPNGVGTSDVAASLELSGGDPRVAEVFNRGVRTYIQEQLDAVGHSDDPRPHSVHSTGKISVTDSTISEVISGLISYQGEAHPFKILATITTDSHAAAPVLIGDLFTDRQAGIAELSAAATEATKQVHPQIADSPTITAALLPTEKNFANWVPTRTGIQIYIDTGLYVYGYPCVEVPWSRLRPALGPVIRPVAEKAPDAPPTACTGP
ncbi:hypothetical protein ACFYO1_25180 [Nocardia sp. NPDC006044]|uniref:hypothetical protein n=1 Tax=Nocardia sp. NPDC006044 TaxID=3364306 RepID=UPI0036A9D8A5